MLDVNRGIKGFFPKGAACWTLDGTPSGLVDQYGNGNNLTPRASALPYPIIDIISGNSGYYFDNTNNRSLTVADSVSLRPASMTIGIWYKHNAGNNKALLVKMRNGTTGASFSLTISVASEFNFILFDAASRIANSSITPIQGRIYFIAGIADVATNKIRIFVFSNGQLLSIGEAAWASGTITYNTGIVIIGSFTSGGFSPDGIIGPALILPYAETPSRLMDYYKYETEPVRKYWFIASRIKELDSLSVTSIKTKNNLAITSINKINGTEWI